MSRRRRGAGVGGRTAAGGGAPTWAVDVAERQGELEDQRQQRRQPHGRLFDRNHRIAKPNPRLPSHSKCNIITFASRQGPRPDNLLTLQRVWPPPLSARAGWRRNLKPAVLKPGQTRENRGGTAIRMTIETHTIAARRTGRGARRRLRARRLSPHRAADPAAGRAVPRPVRRGHPQAHVPHRRRRRPRTVPAAGPDHPGVVRLSRLARRRLGSGLLLSRPGVPRSRRDAGGVRAGRHRVVRPGRQGRGRRRDAGARPRRDRALRHRQAGNPHGRRRTVLRAGRGARSGAGLEAPAGEGLQPQDLARARPRRAHARMRPRTSRSTRAFWRLSNRSDPKAAHALVTDLLSIAGITTVGGRTVGEIAERFLEQAALGAATTLPRRDAHADRKIPRHRRRSRRGRGRTACARRLGRSPHRAGARSVREPHRLSRRARHRRRRASASRPRSAAASTTTPASCSSCTMRRPRRTGRWSPAAATTNCSRGSARRRRSPRSALRSGSSASPMAEASHERAARHRRAGQGPLAGEHRGVLRPRRPDADQAARRTRLSRRDRRTCPASRSPISRPARSPARSRRARSISASPARTCCAR